MSEQKSHQFRPPLYHDRTGNGSSDRAGGKRASASEKKDQQGWEAYRRWLASTGSSRASGQRSPRDHSIYSWKGYQSWADKVRQSWKPEDT